VQSIINKSPWSLLFSCYARREGTWTMEEGKERKKKREWPLGQKRKEEEEFQDSQKKGKGSLFFNGASSTL
jgi:hypothetical protein